METYLVSSFSRDRQEALYTSLREKAAHNPNKARLCALPVALSEGALDMLNILEVIEHSAMAIINLVGVLFDPRFSLKDSVKCTQKALSGITGIPVRVCMLPINIFFQTIAILIDPKKVTSMSSNKSPYGVGYIKMIGFNGAVAREPNGLELFI